MDNLEIAYNAEKSWSTVVVTSRECYGCLEMGPYRFFGANAGYKLPSLEDYPIAKHTKANAEGKKTLRPQLRKVSKASFN
ncbi:hypothetical protein I6M49_01065 [Shewanella algae]|uniref:hypothetical protein n=1 Tax=Shewanella algae TaxID=38313 RepID=UPI001AAC460E|nr:hypothetical protein [Shewanella algae]MBO2652068.1 hypothetical protein [Shewanella algae]